MLTSYGQGEFIEEARRVRGRIVMDDNRLFLQDAGGDMAATYVPLEKIVRVSRRIGGLDIRVRTTMINEYRVLVKGRARGLNALARDLTARRGFKKKFLWPEWFDESA